ncbi:MAG: hypothetical protein HY864_13260 [Chloroflexi bacterium]|nr:hypothetical protein [Chloroflexota bacterium]
MATDLMDKIERLEKQLPRWEKGLFAAYGAAITMLGSSICRAFESSYLSAAYLDSVKNIEPVESLPGYVSLFPTITDPLVLKIQDALFVPYWNILGYLLLIVILIPGILLTVHPAWRQVSLAKRSHLIFGYFLAAWVALLSLSILVVWGPDYGLNLLVVGSALALGLGDWWMRRKKDMAEEVFP